MKKPSKQAITWSLNSAAIEFGTSRTTIRKGLRRNGVPTKPTYSTREILMAIAGDLEFERTRVERARADRMEMDLRRKRGETLDVATVNRLLTELVVLPLRERLLALPTTLDVMCNSGSPETARGALKEWVSETLKLLREKIPSEVRNRQA